MKPTYRHIHQALPPEDYTYNPLKDKWYYKRHAADPSDVLAALVRYARDVLREPSAGSWGNCAFGMAVEDPAYSVRVFLNLNTRKNRSRRVKGKDALRTWLYMRGIDLSHLTEDAFTKWVQKRGSMVGRFYDALAAAGYKIMAVARIPGLHGIWASVIEGLSLSSPETSQKRMDAISSEFICESEPEPEPDIRTIRVQNHLRFLAQLNIGR